MNAMRSMARRLIVMSCLLATGLLYPPHGEAATKSTGKPAKRASNRYVPARSTTSPYLDLTRAETGVLPNYFTFVRPKLDQQSINRFHSSEISDLHTATQQTQGDILKLTSPGLRPTGTGATHGNLLHYYPDLSGATR